MSSERNDVPDAPEAPDDTAAAVVEVASDVVLVVASMAATPFLQAISTYFGNALAKGMSTGTRDILRRFIGRQARASLDEPADDIHAIHLRTEDGWQIEMRVDIAPEALAQLPALCDADAPVGEADRRPGAAGTIHWDNAGHWTAMTVSRSGYLVRFTWDAEAERWRERPGRPILVT
ncbi:hypothetical protein GCM10018793_57890 [Streptomyces sulfonofaciens]|uniref:Uncharacterized protein n=1 Tax=Streptomyces sulfonofaciens TaxID=68272 RepID=A0A919L8A4_9ACTN|nr:hypothetical protein [Streptomyces sulfonofaciens]GHH86351.1 hypothetical protein GCM10018793_57890 [Streptomyces sulfonofaciens]